MKKIIHKIRQQPYHVRETIVLASAVVVFALIGIVWFTDFQEDTYALLNPQKAAEQDTAVAEKEESSPFANILSSFGDLKANISEFFTNVKENKEEAKVERIPQNLPLSE